MVFDLSGRPPAGSVEREESAAGAEALDEGVCCERDPTALMEFGHLDPQLEVQPPAGNPNNGELTST